LERVCVPFCSSLLYYRSPFFFPRCKTPMLIFETAAQTILVCSPSSSLDLQAQISFFIFFLSSFPWFLRSLSSKHVFFLGTPIVTIPPKFILPHLQSPLILFLRPPTVKFRLCLRIARPYCTEMSCFLADRWASFFSLSPVPMSFFLRLYLPLRSEAPPYWIFPNDCRQSIGPWVSNPFGLYLLAPRKSGLSACFQKHIPFCLTPPPFSPPLTGYMTGLTWYVFRTLTHTAFNTPQRSRIEPLYLLLTFPFSLWCQFLLPTFNCPFASLAFPP